MPIVSISIADTSQMGARGFKRVEKGQEFVLSARPRKRGMKRIESKEDVIRGEFALDGH